MRTKSTVQFLVGSVTVYVIVAACAGGDHRPTARNQPTNGGGPGAQGAAGAVAAGGEGLLPGVPDGSGNVPDSALFDAITDPVPDAQAQTTSLCASCTGTGLRVVTADLDSGQVVTGSVALATAALGASSTVKVADGPLFIVHGDTPTKVNYYTVKNSDSCAFDPASTTDDTANVPGAGGVQFAAHHLSAGGSLARAGQYAIKLRVMADEKLCVSQVGDPTNQISPTPYPAYAKTLRWQGFRPYQ